MPGVRLRAGPRVPTWPGPHLAVLEPQLDLGVVHNLAQVPHGHPAPPLLENAQQWLVRVFSLALQAREVLWGAALMGGACAPG